MPGRWTRNSWTHSTWTILLVVPVVLACLLPRCDSLGETLLCLVLVVGLVPAMGRLVSFLINRHATTKK